MHRAAGPSRLRTRCPFEYLQKADKENMANESSLDACFNDWKRFCFVLREIASGLNGRPLSGLEAQKYAQAVLIECGYTSLTRPQQHVTDAPKTAQQSGILYSISESTSERKRGGRERR
jgi:hypothetical protein